jgi:acylphosphatase
MAQAAREQCEVWYRGRVQGVGFRQTAREVAGEHAVTGFVRNDPDGRVQLVAEGDRDAVQRFLTALNDRMADCIAAAEIRRSPASGAYGGFEIRRF